MLLRTNKIGIGCMLLASAMALGGFLLIDKYDDKKGFVSNVMEARYTVWKDCKKQGDSCLRIQPG
jgi:hypothetical protein